VGMSYYGYQILYHILNSEEDIRADRAYAPWPDFEALIRKHKIPLYGLETKAPLKEFDVLGFTLPYELTFTNVLNILDMAGIPVLSDQRNHEPLIIAGGSSVFNPEPLADFIDLFVVGDSEEFIVPLVRFLAERRRRGHSREKILRAAAMKFPGVYAPMFYQDLSMSDNGLYVGPPGEGLPRKIFARKIQALKKNYYPSRPLMPVIEIAQDRMVAEIMRGCTQGCRFCQAGMIYRPVRERDPKEISEQIIDSLTASGYNDVSLLSLSTSDYNGIGELIRGISGFIDEHKVGLSLPSLRLDTFSEDLAIMAQKVRKSGLTFAPEAGSERLRKVINKNISEDDLMNSVDIALKYGWRTLKLYFMLGLPTETDDDIAEIVRLTRAVYDRACKKVSVNVTLSTFIPKPFTPFQWEAQNTPEEIQHKLDMIKKGVAPFKRIKIMARDTFFSQLEGAISRGDRRMGRVILAAWEKGARFDSWRELFKPDKWQEAFEEKGVEQRFYTSARNVDEPLPWDHIDACISRKFLIREREKAYMAETSPDCRSGCIGCGVCVDKLSMRLIETEGNIKEEPDQINFHPGSEDEIIYRLRYQKTGPARFISHLDTLRIFQQALQRTGLHLSFTRGFNQRPKIAAGYPLPLGYSSQDEYIDIVIYDSVESRKNIANLELPDGITITSADPVHSKGKSLFATTKGFEYEVRFAEKLPEDLQKRSDDLMKRPEIMVIRTRKQKTRRVNIRPFIRELVCRENQRIVISLYVKDGQTARPEEILKEMGINQKPEMICRLKTYFNETMEKN